jgi:hypothetical protein
MRRLAAIIVLLLLATPAILAQAGPFSGPAQLSLTPSASRVNITTTFTVELKVDLTGVTGTGPEGSQVDAVLGAYTIAVAFDKNRLELMSVAGGSTAEYNDTPAFTTLGNANTAGSVTLSATSSPEGPTPPPAGTTPTGLISVAQLTFRGDASGLAALNATASSLASAIKFGTNTVGPARINANAGPATVTVNTAPTANALSPSTSEDTAVGITLSGSDPELDSLTFSIVSGPTGGGLSGSGSARTYTPNADFNGTDSFTYKANDGLLDSPPATVTITVNAVNDPPTIAPIGNVSTAEDSTAQNVAITGIAPGPANESAQTLTFAVTSSNETVVPVPTLGALVSGTVNLSYTPAANQYGTSTIRVTATDNGSPALGFFREFTITVTPVNDPPTIAAISDPSAIDEDAAAQAVALSGITPGPGPEGTDQSVTLSFSSSNTDLISSVTFDSISSGASVARYQPNANQHGSTVITVTATDDDSSPLDASRTFTVVVNPVNDAPVANGQSLTTGENTPKEITLTGSDLETASGSLTFAIVSGQGPSSGTLSGTPPAVTYTPNAAFTGTDSFQFTVSDGSLTSNPATIEINVSAQAPTVTNLSPDTKCEGADPFVLTVTGTNFNASTTLLWNASPRTTTPGGLSSLSATIATADVLAVGDVSVSVSKPGVGVSNGLTFSVTEDSTLPVVTAPLGITVDQTTCVGAPKVGGATPGTSTALNSWFGGSSATDECSSVVQQTPLRGGNPIDSDTLFVGGSNTVAFRYNDGAGNTGTATANVFVQLYGDLDSTGAVAAADLVVLSNYLVGNLSPGVGSFNAPLRFANLNGDLNGPDPLIDALDLVLLSNHAVGNIDCLPRP